MPSLNQAEFIATAVASVLNQDYPHIELIVADGGSSDSTVAVLEALAKGDSRLRWFSRRDRGPAHALNDALKLVRGTTIGWLNSDDEYSPGAVQRVQQVLLTQPSCLMVYGLGQHIDSRGTILNIYPTLPPSTPISRFAEGCFICQPTMFFRRSAWVMLGPLDESFKAAFDFDYWMRAFAAFRGRISFVDAVQASSRLHDDCITMRLRRTVALEGMRVLAHHLGKAPKEWLLTYMDELRTADPILTAAQLRDDLRKAIDEASSWLAPQEQLDLEAAIEQRLL